MQQASLRSWVAFQSIMLPYCVLEQPSISRALSSPALPFVINKRKEKIRRIKRVFKGAGGGTASHRQEGVERRFETESSVQSLVYCLVFNLCAECLNTCKAALSICKAIMDVSKEALFEEFENLRILLAGVCFRGEDASGNCSLGLPAVVCSSICSGDSRKCRCHLAHGI